MGRYLIVAVVLTGLLSTVAAQDPIPSAVPGTALPPSEGTPAPVPLILGDPPPLPRQVSSSLPDRPPPALPLPAVRGVPTPPASLRPLEMSPAVEVPAARAVPPVELPRSEAPQVTVETVAPESANVGQPVAQEIVIRNTGKSAVYQVHVEQELPGGARYLGGEPRAESANDRLQWNLGVLDAGMEKRIRVELRSQSEGDLRTRATVSYAVSCGAVTRLTRPRLVVAISGPDTVLVGEPAIFQIKLSNTGSGPIRKLILRDQLPAGLQHPQGAVLEAEVAGLAPGESRTVTLKTTAVKVGSYVHEIQAAADGQPLGDVQLTGGPPPNADLEASARSEVKVLQPALQVSLSGAKICLVKCECVLSIDLTNPGSAPARNIRVVTRVPEGTAFAGVSDDGLYDHAAHTASWALPVLEPGAHRVLTMKVRGITLGDGLGVAVAQADGGLSAKSEMPLKVEGIPALSLEVADPDDPAPVGADATYEIRVLNQGTCPCTGIQIVAVMPEGMEMREASAPVPYKVQGQQVQFGSFAQLATKADLVYRLKVRSRVPGDVRFRVQLTCDQLQQPVLKEESSRFYKP